MANTHITYTLAELRLAHPAAYADWLDLLPYLDEYGEGYPKFELENGMLHGRIDDIDEVDDVYVWAVADGQCNWANIRGASTATPGLYLLKSQQWAVEELMGHLQTLGRIIAYLPREWRGCWVGGQSGTLHVLDVAGLVWREHPGGLVGQAAHELDEGDEQPAYVAVNMA